ncbi:hypothetical protein [Corallibacter sp.]|uniref:hypothetical protein n=1 Tax=Corallibacter sp. TaxID=2038084 RepID=UPI003AB41718
MKTLLYITAFMFMISVHAQEKPKNVSEETNIKTVKINDGKKITEKKVKLTTREEQQVELAEEDKNKVNQTMVDSPSKVTKTLEVDNDGDAFYDSKFETAHYEFNDKVYNFKKNSEGFLVSTKSKSDMSPLGNIIKSSKENHYFFKTNDYSGIGYFTDSGNFTIEYYDTNTNKLVKQDFILIKK